MRSASSPRAGPCVFTRDPPEPASGYHHYPAPDIGAFFRQRIQRSRAYFRVLPQILLECNGVWAYKALINPKGPEWETFRISL